MLNRAVVSVCAFVAAMISLSLAVMSALWDVQGKLNQTEAIFMLGGWLLAAGIFAWRAADPDYLDPLSIVKGR
jgi:hypothetical protein